MGVYPSIRSSAAHRWWRNIEVGAEGGCWNWTAGRTPQGYGNVRHLGRHVYAHRFAYEQIVGAIPAGLQIDHLCRNPSCVNPDHLEPVTNRENARRGLKAQRTHCKNGHPFDDRTIIYRGYRRCRTCRDYWNAARYSRRSR